jgi:hypothetical protein
MHSPTGNKLVLDYRACSCSLSCLKCIGYVEVDEHEEFTRRVLMEAGGRQKQR